MQHARITALLSALTVLTIPLSAAAQQAAQNRERASIVLGAFITDRDTQARLDSGLGRDPGSDLDLENDLGLKSSTTVFRLGGHIWLGERRRNRFDFSVFDFSRSATKQIDETIEFGDEVFEIDTTVSTESDLSIVKADYTFAVIDRQRGYFGVTGGLYIAETKLRLSEPTLGRAESGDLTAPLPVAGFRGEYDITERITLGGAAQWFSIDVDEASGSLRDVYVGADYRFGERFAVGLAWNAVDMNVSAEDAGRFEGRLDWGYDGWLLYFKSDIGR